MPACGRVGAGVGLQCALGVSLSEIRHAIDDRILGAAEGTAEHAAHDVALLGLVRRRDQPGWLVRPDAAEGVDKLDEHALGDVLRARYQGDGSRKFRRARQTAVVTRTA